MHDQTRLDSDKVLTVVVIGLNEEARLGASLRAVINHKPHGLELEVYYVDSGSKDASVAIASSIEGVKVLHLNDDKPSAAKARNLGLKNARGCFVQLLDGDSVLQPGWLEKAISYLEQNPDVSCVFGHCIEMHPEQNIYMKVCGMDWHVQPGEYRLCGGNALWRKSTFDQVGLFDADLRLGEEPDLCYRVRNAGGRIVCIDAPMVMHDLDMQSFWQYWKRAENSGKAYASVALRYWRNTEKLWLYETVRNFFEPLIWLVLLLAGSAVLGLVWGIVLLVAWWGVRSIRTAWKNRHRAMSFFDALLYGIHTQLIRIPVVVGQIKTILSRKQA